MIRRCHDPGATGFHLWGGRGIKVCERWRESFANFLADMGATGQESEAARHVWLAKSIP